MQRTHFDVRRVVDDQFLRFLIVGASGTLIDIGLLAVFKETTPLPTLLANTLSYSAGILNNFTLNRWWTFPGARGKRALVQLVQFVAISLVGLALNTALVVTLEAPFNTVTGSSGYLLAKLVATGLVVLWNFFANRMWTFQEEA